MLREPKYRRNIKQGRPYFASYIKVRNQEIVVFLWTCLSHVFLYFDSPFLSKSGCSVRHRKQAKVIFSEQEDVKSVQLHGQRNVAEDPLQNPRIGEVWSRKDPVLRSNDLCEGFDLSLVDQSWDNLGSSA